jgi:hypothetical protein
MTRFGIHAVGDLAAWTRLRRVVRAAGRDDLPGVRVQKWRLVFWSCPAVGTACLIVYWQHLKDCIDLLGT